jgi:hypothetical protein
MFSERRGETHPAAPRPTVRLLVILDRSLSMAPYEQQVTEALRNFVTTLQNAPDQPRYVATLVTFADEPETICLLQPLEKLTIDYKVSDKGTALWDGMAFSFLLEKSRHERVICLIITDGEENCSQEASQRQVAAMIQTRREWGNWTFLWLNLQGKPSRNAKALNIDCLNSTREDIGKALPEMAERISRAAARLGGNNPRVLPEGRR